MKYLLILLTGFVLAQAADYSASQVVNVMQKKCYPLWTAGKQVSYQMCMEDQKALNALERVLGFNVMYTGRKILYGY